MKKKEEKAKHKEKSAITVLSNPSIRPNPVFLDLR